MEQKTGVVTSFLPDFCEGRLVFVVILMAELLAMLLTLAQPPNTTDLLYELAVYSMFIQWVALSCVASLCLARQMLNRLGDAWAATGSYFLTLLVTFVVAELTWWLLDYFPAGFTLSRDNHFTWLVRCMSISAIVSAMALRYFYVQHQWRRRVELEAQARFQALQSRIRPHFLFNCMNTIASLTRSDAKLAEQSVEDLADLFRASLQEVDHVSRLADEIELCRRYLRIEQHRLGSRLKVNWALDTLPEGLRIPSLSLQPLLENAIYHGIEPLEHGGTIEIRSETRAREFCISVENPLPPQAANTQHQGNRLAQDNIRQRLAAYFGDSARLELEQQTSRYRVTLIIPIDDEDPDR